MRGNRLDIKGQPCHCRGTPLRAGACPCRDQRQDPILNAPGANASGEYVQEGFGHD